MSKRHESLGIKHLIRLEWMEKVVELLQGDMTGPEIRQDLDDYLSSRKQSGGVGIRGPIQYSMAVPILMRSWVKPAVELIPFVNAAKKLVRKPILNKSERTAIHWAVLSAAYPFWFNVAVQVGRLLNLQDHITRQQIMRRLKEHYGDRQTVIRNARYVIRSFVAWGILKDTEKKGRYTSGDKITINSHQVAALLLECGLHTMAEGKATLGVLYNNPGFFIFDIPVTAGKQVCQLNPRIEVLRFGLDDELLKLKE